ncbi:MAG: hypothetical protein QXI43_00175 [Candidatus Nitrosocaldus sp.]
MSNMEEAKKEEGIGGGGSGGGGGGVTTPTTTAATTTTTTTTTTPTPPTPLTTSSRNIFEDIFLHYDDEYKITCNKAEFEQLIDNLKENETIIVHTKHKDCESCELIRQDILRMIRELEEEEEVEESIRSIASSVNNNNNNSSSSNGSRDSESPPSFPSSSSSQTPRRFFILDIERGEDSDYSSSYSYYHNDDKTECDAIVLDVLEKRKRGSEGEPPELTTASKLYVIKQGGKVEEINLVTKNDDDIRHYPTILFDLRKTIKGKGEGEGIVDGEGSSR